MARGKQVAQKSTARKIDSSKGNKKPNKLRRYKPKGNVFRQKAPDTSFLERYQFNNLGRGQHYSADNIPQKPLGMQNDTYIRLVNQIRARQNLPKIRPRVTGIMKKIRDAQKGTQLLMLKLPFSRLLRQIASGYKQQLRFQHSAVIAMQTAAQQFLLKLYQDANRAAQHGQRKTLMTRDLKLAMRLRGDKLFNQAQLKNRQKPRIPKQLALNDQNQEQ